MTAWRIAIILLLFTLPAAGFGQNYNLTESPKPGECCRVVIETSVNGSIKVSQEGKESAIRVVAKNEHSLLERVLLAEKGVVSKSARHYEKAISRGEVGSEIAERRLRDSRRLVVAQRSDDQLLCYSPSGPLTRPELEVISEHFDTLHLTGMLPAKDVTLNESWTINNQTAQSMCLFEGLISHDLTGKLTDVKDGLAFITVVGKAAGIELGASAKLEVTATIHFDLLKRRIVSMEWKQKDVRELGPASPASEMDSVTNLKRELLLEEPRELSRAALVGVPQDEEPQEVLKLLQHKDAKDRYAFLYTRDWHVVGQTDSHLVLRLLDRGDFVAQATIAIWKKEGAGKHTSVEDFKKQIAEAPNWEMEEVSETGEIPTDGGRWIYRVTAKGVLEGTKVVQNFILVAGPQGDQVVVTFTMKPANVAKIGTRDLAIVNAIEFTEKK